MGKKSRRSKAGKKGNSKPSRVSASGSSGGEDFRPSVVAAYSPDTSRFGPTPSAASVLDFWAWFEGHDAALRALPRDEEADRIERELHKVNRGLTYELGRISQSSSRNSHAVKKKAHRSSSDGREIHHLIISADGRLECFNAVLSLIRAAPTTGALVDNWLFTAFRDRRPNASDISISLSDCPSYPADWIRYALTGSDPDEHRDRVGICLFFDEVGNFDEMDEEQKRFLSTIGFLYLDHILGEYDVEVHVGGVDFRTQREGRGMLGERRWRHVTHPIAQLRRNFDERLAEKVGRSRPEGGWSALADLSRSSDAQMGVSGGRNAPTNRNSPTSVVDNVDRGGGKWGSTEADDKMNNKGIEELQRTISDIQQHLIACPNDPNEGCLRAILNNLVNQGTNEDGTPNLELIKDAIVETARLGVVESYIGEEEAINELASSSTPLVTGSTRNDFDSLPDHLREICNAPEVADAWEDIVTSMKRLNPSFDSQQLVRNVSSRMAQRGSDQPGS